MTPVVPGDHGARARQELGRGHGPRGEDHVKGRTEVVCQRHSVGKKLPPGASHSVLSASPRSIISPLQLGLPLQGSDLGAITGWAEIGTFRVHEGEPWEALIG